MILPLRTDSPLRSTPWMNWLLIALNVLAFAAQKTVWANQENPLLLQGSDPRLWQYFTYAFLHANTPHLVGNMLFLYIFGNNVNDKMGPWGYLGFYLAGGVMAGVGYVLTSDNPILGASGAVSAITGAYLALFPRASITVVYFFWLIGTFEISSVYFIIFFFLQDVFLNFAGASGVAHMAHISGSIFGFLICVLFLALRLLPRDQFDFLAVLHRWNKRRQYKQLVHQGFDPFGAGPMGAGQQAGQLDPAQEELLHMRADVAEALARHDDESARRRYQQLVARDAAQVLSRPQQLEIANVLAHHQYYAQAAEAYEKALQIYAPFDQMEKIQLMLGLIYARYLAKSEPARKHLTDALAKLHNEREIQLARAELSQLPPPR